MPKIFNVSLILVSFSITGYESTNMKPVKKISKTCIYTINIKVSLAYFELLLLASNSLIFRIHQIDVNTNGRRISMTEAHLCLFLSAKFLLIRALTCLLNDIILFYCGYYIIFMLK